MRRILTKQEIGKQWSLDALVVLKLKNSRYIRVWNDYAWLQCQEYFRNTMYYRLECSGLQFMPN